MRRHVLLLAPLLLMLTQSCQRGRFSDRVISAGKSSGDSLTSRDPTRRNSGPYQVWTLRGKRGERLVIDMNSTAFDPFLALRDAEGFLLGADDDGGGGLNARLRVVLPRSGAYRLLATSINGSARGWYTLSVGEWATPDAPPPGREATIAVGEGRTGLLEPRDEQAGDGPFQDRWVFDLRQEQSVRVEMGSTELDSYLSVLGPDGSTVAWNDDYGTGRDAVVRFTAAAAGRYTALASSYGNQPGFGAYRITLAEAPALAGSKAVATIYDDSTVQGRLEEGDSTAERGFVDLYSYTPARSGAVTIDLRSADFDALLWLEDQGGATIASDDDGGGGRDSRIVLTVTAGTTYRIKVGAFSGGQRGGAYTLSVRTVVTAT